ncbi:MAG: hypothetical protein QXU09_05055 [Thermoproteota archaeon]
MRTLRTIFEDAFNSFKWVALLRLEGLKRYLYVKVKQDPRCLGGSRYGSGLDHRVWFTV